MVEMAICNVQRAITPKEDKSYGSCVLHSSYGALSLCEVS